MRRLLAILSFWLLIQCFFTNEIIGQETFEFRGRVIDQASRKLIFSRVYLADSLGRQYTVQSAEKSGKAIPYSVQRGRSQEVHTTLSDHVFRVQLPAGEYQLHAEHGKEYLPNGLTFEITDQPVQKTVELKRWTNLAAKNWYSGEVHLHRPVAELPTVLQAEDLNVALPLTYWVTDTESTPANNNKSSGKVPMPQLITVTDRHVIWPVNSEYEIFTVRGRKHTLGAFFVLGHSSPLNHKAPPVKAVLEQARRENALIDLDKHNWPWSMMLIPTMKVDLFELTNNHVWRTKFLFKDWYKEYVADYMQLELDNDGSFTPKGWLDFGFSNYYALLNCGFQISPSGGTASGVHPVPAGFGRVYVHLPQGFSYQAWMKGLKQGNSFVTNGPMLDVKLNDQYPGRRIDLDAISTFNVDITAKFPRKGATSLQVIVNGKVIDPTTIHTKDDHNGIRILNAKSIMKINQPGWLCVRCYQKLSDGNIAFAHSAPFYFSRNGKTVTPRKKEVQYLMKRITAEIKRNKNVLGPEQIAEYESALEFYRQKLKLAR